ncbi:uncharacterized protein LOC106026078 isoform X2 [Cavia porcellus]|uniref:uncharacterized protein LOC106026078 isoform X2 n=1 Tax=Cavia porcellus TaxID=10141 RepID=UPI002FE11951
MGGRATGVIMRSASGSARGRTSMRSARPPAQERACAPRALGARTGPRDGVLRFDTREQKKGPETHLQIAGNPAWIPQPTGLHSAARLALGSLCSPGCSQTCRDPPASASQVWHDRCAPHARLETEFWLMLIAPWPKGRKEGRKEEKRPKRGGGQGLIYLLWPCPYDVTSSHKPRLLKGPPPPNSAMLGSSSLCTPTLAKLWDPNRLLLLYSGRYHSAHPVLFLEGPGPVGSATMETQFTFSGSLDTPSLHAAVVRLGSEMQSMNSHSRLRQEDPKWEYRPGLLQLRIFLACWRLSCLCLHLREPRAPDGSAGSSRPGGEGCRSKLLTPVCQSN